MPNATWVKVNVRGISLPSQLGMGDRHSSPNAVQGRAPVENDFRAFCTQKAPAVKRTFKLLPNAASLSYF